MKISTDGYIEYTHEPLLQTKPARLSVVKERT
ncbi:hypothetical protein BSn5_05690 [Bacillus subtilis BSn5]|nr:hypothetical protein BSn5_05690 [Bacillus subtilis BSn5]BAO93496.1 hypothetical protein BSNT_09386 [Bacillus subtilis subsp. natto BEST195]